jgi:hypothetical protein
MKNRKLNWQSVAAGMILCAVLVVFIGSRAADAQVISRANVQRAASTADIYEKTVAVEERIVAMEERLVRIEKKIDEMNNDMTKVLRALKKINNELE